MRRTALSAITARALLLGIGSLAPVGDHAQP
jgi:hypothetical protein